MNLWLIGLKGDNFPKLLRIGLRSKILPNLIWVQNFQNLLDIGTHLSYVGPKIFLLLGGRNEAKQRTGLGCARAVHDGLYGNDQDPGCNSWSELLRRIGRSRCRHQPR